jgi:hypothetical protein
MTEPSAEERNWIMSNTDDFEIKNGVLTKYVGPGGDVVIPEGVTAIGDKAFQGGAILTDVVFPESLRVIGFNAFPDVVSGLVITLPKNVEKLGGYCLSGIRELIVYDSATLEGLGLAAGSYGTYTLFTVKNSETDTVRYRVLMCCDGEPEKVQKMLASAWGKNASFDFSALDAVFDSYKKIDDRIRTAVLRLQYPVDLTPETKTKYMTFLKRNGAKLIPALVEEGDTETLSVLLDCDAAKADAMDAWI